MATVSQLLIMAENLLKTNYVSLFTSTIKAGYSLDDLTSYQRNIHFSFGGTFVIDETNNVLNIDGNTYNLTQGQYVRGDLIAHINTLLDGTGITLSWSDNGFFRFQKIISFDFDTTTGDGILNTLGFNNNVNYNDVLEVNAINSRYHFPCEFIEVDFGYTPNMGFLGMVTSSLKEFGLSSQAKVKVMASQVNNFDLPAFTKFATITTEGAYLFLTDDEYDFRFWRIEIEDNNNDKDVEIGYLYLGEAHTFNKAFHDQGSEETYNDFSEIYKTENGGIIPFERQAQKTFGNIVFRYVEPETRSYIVDVWKRFKTVRPFFIALDPNVEISKSIEDLTMLCSFRASPLLTHVVANRWDFTIEVDEWL